MSGRWEARPQSDAGLPLEGLATLIRAWRRHWDEVGTIQQSLPLAARQRVEERALGCGERQRARRQLAGPAQQRAPDQPVLDDVTERLVADRAMVVVHGQRPELESGPADQICRPIG